MWPRWTKNSRGTTTAADAESLPVATANKTPSFKDIQSLFQEEEKEKGKAAAANPKNSPSPSSSPSNIFHRVRIASAAVRTWKSHSSSSSSNNASSTAAKDNRIVLYYTSLRVVRSTFEDCRSVRSILRGFRVAIDERDLSMDSSFLNELKGILGKKQLHLPRVFIGGRYIGGAEEVQHLHETGELKKIIEGVPVAHPAGAGGTCEACGGFRFLLCGSCSGSHKYYHPEKGMFRTCKACNENGLVRCPECAHSC